MMQESIIFTSGKQLRILKRTQSWNVIKIAPTKLVSELIKLYLVQFLKKSLFLPDIYWQNSTGAVFMGVTVSYFINVQNQS